VRTFGGHAALRAAPPKQKADALTVDDKVGMWSSPCYLCGRAPAFGIDRVDPDGDYTASNCMPCCTPCNYMKKDAALAAFLGHLDRVHGMTSSWVIGDVSELAIVTCAGNERLPVAVDVNGGTLVFPSITTAALIIGRSKQRVQRERLSRHSARRACLALRRRARVPPTASRS
jgi:hypothetical protein